MVTAGAGTVPGVQIYQFRGGAASWFGTRILGALITICTIGICYPFALVLIERWRAKNTFLYGRQLQFVGTGWGIIGLWIKWALLSIISLGIYTFWVYPRLMQWKVEKRPPGPGPLVFAAGFAGLPRGTGISAGARAW